MTTEEQLDALTDYGLFEKVCVAVLRAANLDYHRLVHVGINASGKTIRSSFDALVPPAAGTKMVVVACATTARNKLRDKWLSSDSGDVPDAIARVSHSRDANPLQAAVLVLCTNRTPDERLLYDVGTACLEARIELDIWDRSRIAAFLDHDTAGQWLRQDLLGIPATRLSPELLLSLGLSSLALYSAKVPDSDTLAERADERVLTSRVGVPGLTLLCGVSGFGKTATCLRVMRARLASGASALWLPETVLERESGLESAIRNVFAELHRARLEGDPLQATGGAPLLVLIDDLAASRDPVRALEKVFGWCQSARILGSVAEPGKRTVHVLAPIWPQFLFGVRSDWARRLMPNVIDLRPLMLPEAVTLYRCRSSHHGRVDALQTDEEARSIVERLGCDPLLIDLYGGLADHMAYADHRTGESECTPEEVIWSWIEREILNVSRQTGVPTQRYSHALRQMGIAMLRARTLAPDAIRLPQLLAPVDRVAGTDSSYADVLAVIAAKTLLSWTADGADERLSFRHDRVRDTILIRVLCTVMDTAPDDEILQDPYYYEFLGHALIWRKFRKADLQLVRAIAPLALFSALKTSGQAGRPSNSDLIKAIFYLLRSQSSEQPLPRAFFDKASELLADTSAPEVKSICDELPVNSHWITEAFVRNGCVDAALEFVRTVELSAEYPRRERLVAHAAQRHTEFIPTVVRRLVSPDAGRQERRALLLLAGYIGRVELESAIEVSLLEVPPKSPEEIESALWAVTQCCHDKLQSLLDVVFKNWIHLPPRWTRVIPEGGANREPRVMGFDSLIDMGGLTIARRLPGDAIPHVIQSAARYPQLISEITLFLCQINDPRALSYVVRQRAMAMRTNPAVASRIYLDLKGHTDFQYPQDDGKLMTASQGCLEAIWMADTEPIEDRRSAYLMWRVRARAEDLWKLQRTPSQDAMATYLLEDRVRLGDKSASGAFLEEIRRSTPQQLAMLWMNARGVMDEQLAQGLDDCLSRHSGHLFDGLARILAGLLMELATDTAAPIVCKHWSVVRESPAFVQAALYIESPATRALATDAIQRAPDRTRILQSVVEQFGIRYGLYSPENAESLVRSRMDLLIPYIDDLPELDLINLWEGCNNLGCLDWRKYHVDERISKLSRSWLAFLDIPADVQASLDDLCPEDDFRLGWVASNCLAAGYSLEEAFSLIADWARQQRSFVSLSVAAELFGAEASREVLPLFDQLVDGSEQQAQLRAAVHFAVKVRTLA